MSGGDIAVRPATPEDLAAIMRFVRDLAAYEKLTQDCVATEAQIGAALFSTPPRVHALIAQVEDQPVGLALWFHTFSTFTGRSSMYLEDLFVDPAFRGRGVGRPRVGARGRRGGGAGGALRGVAVVAWNETALRFYRSLGAKPLDEWTLQRLTGPALAALAAG
jgi:GNAT superfamily N-acetyltransferase